MQLLPVSSFQDLTDLLRVLRPEGHHVIVNATHPLVAGNAEALPRLVREAEGAALDFDGTCHAGNQWQVVREWLLPEDREADVADAAAYFARSAHDDAEDVAFILRSVERMRRNKKRYQTLLDAMGTLLPRRGFEPLVRSFPAERCAIVTFGLHPLVDQWLKAHCWDLVHSRPPELFGLQLNWGRGFPEPLLGTVVTDGNKGYVRRAFCGARGILPKKTLVVGDSPTDIFMMGPDVVGCLLIPRIDPQPGRMEHRLARLEEMWSRVACVLVSDSLEPLAQMRK